MEEDPIIRVVLLDIEGTTSSISFVSDVLFPYVRRELRSYLDANWDNEQLIQDIELLRKLAHEDEDMGIKNAIQIPEDNGTNKHEIIEAIALNVGKQMDMDRKTTALKQLQGHIWLSGYKQGVLQGHVYEDSYEAFQKWKNQDLPIFIYSSGSIAAQKLLFGYSEKGDLLPYFRGHFDTTIGVKLQSTSYLKIFEAIKAQLELNDLKIGQVLFVTDNFEEAKSASQVHMSTVVSIRPGTRALPDGHKFKTITTFDSLFEMFEFAENGTK